MSGKLERAIVPALLLAAVYYAIFGGEYTVFELRSARAAAAVEAERLASVRGTIDSLGAYADSLRTDDATIERIAREDFGMIRDGEVLYRFVEAPPEAPGEHDAGGR